VSGSITDFTALEVKLLQDLHWPESFLYIETEILVKEHKGKDQYADGLIMLK
jgi:hypothetical protein